MDEERKAQIIEELESLRAWKALAESEVEEFRTQIRELETELSEE